MTSLRKIIGRYFDHRERGQPLTYKAEFPETADAFRRFLARIPLSKIEPDALPVGMVIMPWVGTPSPWFVIALGLGLAKLCRRPLVFVWDDIPFPERSAFWQQQNEAIGQNLSRLPSGIRVTRLSEIAEHELGASDSDLLDRVTDLNLLWSLRGGQPTETDLRKSRAVRASLATSLARIRAALRCSGFHCLVVPGGTYGSSHLFLSVAAEQSLPCITFDAGIGWLQSCVNGVAAQQTDIPVAFEALLRSSALVQRRAAQLGRAEFEKRLQARDNGRFQVVSATGEANVPVDILLPLNIDFDAAALGRHKFFGDTAEWVLETASYVLASHPGAIVVRQHPAERRPIDRSKSDIQLAVAERFAGNPRVKFVAASDPISTYDLLKEASLVLPLVSTIGIEAAALGKTVILAGNCYYGSLGFVWNPVSRVEYFALLDRALAGQLAPLPDQVHRAWLCYYLTQVCNRIWTSFTPQPADFWKWQQLSPESIYTDPSVVDFMCAIEQIQPLSLVRHRRFAEID